MHRLKVRALRAIIASGNRYALTVEHLRIVLNRRLWWHLNECKVLVVQKLIALHIAAQHAHIVLTSLRLSILAKQCFQIHANIRVRFQTFLIYIHDSILSGKASASHEGPFRTTGKVRLAFGPTLDHFSRCLVLQS